MFDIVDILEERVAAAADLIGRLRAKVQSLEQELAATRTIPLAQPPQPPQHPANPALVGELERLRSERIVIRENIRGLLREIDRISW